MKIGVLAFQGGFAAHCKMLSKLGVTPIEVRSESQLDDCQGLILPGGESTAIYRLMEKEHFIAPLKEFSRTRPLFGTCAGMILMAKEQILEIAIERNAYGRQVASFSTPLTLHLTKDHPSVTEALFIRAPRIKGILSSEIEILAMYQGSPVLVRQGHHVGASFHPELTEDLQIHRYFLTLIA